MTSETIRVVLHAEDEPAHAEIIRIVFERSSVKARLYQVEDGKDALDYLYRRGSFADPASSPRPDLILLDLRMPRVDGIGVLTVIKKDPEFAAIPVVVLTTSSSEKDQSEAYACGADSYLYKPVDFQKFITTIEKLCCDFL